MTDVALKKDALFEKIKLCSRKYLDLSETPEYGQVFRNGIVNENEVNFDTSLVYAVQVRRGASKLGHDVIVYRRPNGELMTASHKLFWFVDDELAKEALALFSTSPDHEGGDMSYKVDEIEKSGFIVD